MVTAEAALILPLIALFALALLWVLAVGIAKVETVDAARDAARMIARGDGDAALAAARCGETGASARIDETPAGSVTVTVIVEASAPQWLWVQLLDVIVGGTATTPLEVPIAGRE